MLSFKINCLEDLPGIAQIRTLLLCLERIYRRLSEKLSLRFTKWVVRPKWKGSRQSHHFQEVLISIFWQAFTKHWISCDVVAALSFSPFYVAYVQAPFPPPTQFFVDQSYVLEKECMSQFTLRGSLAPSLQLPNPLKFLYLANRPH